MSDNFEKTVVLDKSDVPRSIRGETPPPEKPETDNTKNEKVEHTPPTGQAWLS